MTDPSRSRDDRADAQAHLVNALERIVGGSSEALDLLYQATSAKLFGVCLRILNDRGEAEDILQEVYLTVWRHAATFDPAKGSAIAWLAAIARHKAIDRRRSTMSAGTRPAPDDAELADPAPLADVALETVEQNQQVSDALEELDAKHADAICHIYRAGLTYDETALRMQVPVGTVKSWVRRRLVKLRTSLES